MRADMALVFGTEKGRKMPADELFTRVTGQSFSSSINRRVAAAHVMHVERVLRVLEKLAVTLFTFAQSLFGLFTLSDVSRSAFVIQDLTRFIQYCACVYRNPDPAAVFAKGFM